MSSKSDAEIDPNSAKTDLCDECKLVKFKYKCPGCFRRTCSLTCVKSHKKVSGCIGKKDLTVFVPLSQFDDSTLISDYNLLEDVKRVAESSQRMRMQLCTYYQHRLPPHLTALQNAADRRQIRLWFFHPGMSKRQKNRTHIMLRCKSIKWTIEWRFHSTDVALLEHMVHEKSTLRSVIKQHLQPSPWRNKLRRFVEESVDNLKFLIRKNQQDPNSPCRELDMDISLRQLLSGLLILEYPIIHVLLPSDPLNFEVVQDMKPAPKEQKSKEPIPNDTPNPVYICSKEEEIIAEESPEPKIFDFLDKSIKELPKASPTAGHATETQDACHRTEVDILEASIGDFDFDQELIDAYSLIMEQGNPNDFLHFNSKSLVGDHENTDVYFADLEDLEEGEIPSFD